MQSFQITAAQHAELQRDLSALIDRARAKHRFSPGVIFEFLISYAWGYARREGETSEAIVNRFRARAEACELAYQRRLSGILSTTEGDGRG